MFCVMASAAQPTYIKRFKIIAMMRVGFRMPAHFAIFSINNSTLNCRAYHIMSSNLNQIFRIFSISLRIIAILLFYLSLFFRVKSSYFCPPHFVSNSLAAFTYWLHSIRACFTHVKFNKRQLLLTVWAPVTSHCSISHVTEAKLALSILLSTDK